jgi:lysozyme
MERKNQGAAMNNFTYSKDALLMTEQFEGCRLKAYRDQVGVLTIGYGHTHNVGPSDTCTQAQAEAWLAEDIQAASSAVNRLVTTQLTQNEHDALTDFVFNLGATAFSNSTMLHYLNAGDHIRAAGQFERWDMAGGKHVAGLLRRRQAEEALFNKGK